MGYGLNCRNSEFQCSSGRGCRRFWPMVDPVVEEALVVASLSCRTMSTTRWCPRSQSRRCFCKHRGKSGSAQEQKGSLHDEPAPPSHTRCVLLQGDVSRDIDIGWGIPASFVVNVASGIHRVARRSDSGEGAPRNMVILTKCCAGFDAPAGVSLRIIRWRDHRRCRRRAHLPRHRRRPHRRALWPAAQAPSRLFLMSPFGKHSLPPPAIPRRWLRAHDERLQVPELWQ